MQFQGARIPYTIYRMNFIGTKKLRKTEPVTYFQDQDCERCRNRSSSRINVNHALVWEIAFTLYMGGRLFHGILYLHSGSEPLPSHSLTIVPQFAYSALALRQPPLLRLIPFLEVLFVLEKQYPTVGNHMNHSIG